MSNSKEVKKNWKTFFEVNLPIFKAGLEMGAEESLNEALLEAVGKLWEVSGTTPSAEQSVAHFDSCEEAGKQAESQFLHKNPKNEIGIIREILSLGRKNFIFEHCIKELAEAHLDINYIDELEDALTLHDLTPEHLDEMIKGLCRWIKANAISVSELTGLPRIYSRMIDAADLDHDDVGASVGMDLSNEALILNENDQERSKAYSYLRDWMLDCLHIQEKRIELFSKLLGGDVGKKR